MRAALRWQRAAIECRAQHAGHAARRRVEEPEGRQAGISDAQRQHAEVRARPRPHDGLAIAQRRAIGRSQHARDRARSRREEQRAEASAARRRPPAKDSMAAEEVHGQGRVWPPASQRTELRWGGARSLRRTWRRHKRPFGAAVGRASGVPLDRSSGTFTEKLKHRGRLGWSVYSSTTTAKRVNHVEPRRIPASALGLTRFCNDCFQRCNWNLDWISGIWTGFSLAYSALNWNFQRTGLDLWLLRNN